MLAPLGFRFWPRPEIHANARPLETKCSTQLILQVPLVGEMQRLRVIHKKDEGWWIHPRLRRVVYLEHLTAINGRIMTAHRILYGLVETRSGDTQETHIGNAQYGFKIYYATQARVNPPTFVFFV